VEALNERRLEWMQTDPSTQYHKQGVIALDDDHGVLFRQLIDWVCEREIPEAFTFDSYFSSSASLNHIHEQKNPQGESRAYVGDLKTNRKLEVRSKSIRADKFAMTIPREDRKELRRGDNRRLGRVVCWHRRDGRLRGLQRHVQHASTLLGAFDSQSDQAGVAKSRRTAVCRVPQWLVFDR